MKWVDPPGGLGRNDKYAYEDEAAELKTAPKHWGLIATFPVVRISGKDNNAGRSVANNIRKGHYVAFRPEGAFESVSRKETDYHGNTVVNVYARYVGEAA